MYIRVYGGEGKNTLGLIIGKALVDAGFKDVFFVGHEGAFMHSNHLHARDPFVKELNTKRILIDTESIDPGKEFDFLPNQLDGVLERIAVKLGEHT